MSIAFTEQDIFLSTNSVQSNQDVLVSCKSQKNGDLKNCFEFRVDDLKNNPIALAANHDHLFIANYGHALFGGTSFLTKCNLPIVKGKDPECISILALFSAAHLTGLQVSGKKLYFIESFKYKNNVSVNYLVSCDLVENKRVPDCGPLTLLHSSLSTSPNGTNMKMDIKVTDEQIFVNDHFGGTLSECSLPNDENELKCKNISSKNVKEKQSYFVAFDIQDHTFCKLEEDETNSIETASLTCCQKSYLFSNFDKLSYEKANCVTLKDQGFFNAKSLLLNSHNSGLYVTSHKDKSNLFRRPQGYLSYCSEGKESLQIENCRFINTEYYSLKGKIEVLGNISNLIFMTEA